MPSDFWSVFCSTPFCKLVVGRATAESAFDRWRFEDPFAVGQTCAVDIAADLVLTLEKSLRTSERREGRSLLPRQHPERRKRILMFWNVQAFWSFLEQPSVSQNSYLFLDLLEAFVLCEQGA